MTKNEIKYYSKLKQKKFRDIEGKFLIEGEHLIEECLKSEFYKSKIENIFIRNDFKNNLLIEKIRHSLLKSDIISLDEETFNKLADTANSQGIIGVLSSQSVNAFINDSRKNLIVALDSINDPGNLGTIIRTCYWFGVDELWLSENSVEMFNPKVIRATQGAIFNLNIKERLNLDEELKKYYENGYEIVLTDLSSDKNFSDFRFNIDGKYIFVFGNEANGINNKILENKNYDRIKINSYSDCESLNISVAVGIILNSFRSKQSEKKS